MFGDLQTFRYRVDEEEGQQGDDDEDEGEQTPIKRPKRPYATVRSVVNRGVGSATSIA